MTMVSDSVYQVIYPRLAGLIARADFRGALVQSWRTGALLLAFTSSAALGVTLFAPPVLRFVLGPSFGQDFLSLDVYMVLRSISCAFVVVHPLFLALGFIKRELGILIVANLLYLGAAWFLGSQFQLLGIVLAYGLQFTAVLAPKLWYIRREVRARIPELQESVA